MATRAQKRKTIATRTSEVVENCAKSNGNSGEAPSPIKTARAGTSGNGSEDTAVSVAAASKTFTAGSKDSRNHLKNDTGEKLSISFFQKECTGLAQALLGKTLVRKMSNGTLLKGAIVETEAYIGEHDKAAHSYKLKRTARNEAMFMEPGTVYVYHIYGMYTCINVSSIGDGCAVLIRAVDPFDHCAATMKTLRSKKRKDGGKGLKITDLCSGPSKLTQAFNIDKVNFNQKHICESDTIWLESGYDIEDSNIVKCARIGVDYAAEWAKKPLRFYVLGNRSISVRDKAQEQSFDAE